MVIEGETTGAWVGLGIFSLPKGSKSFVEVTSQGTAGVAVAGAVLFVPERQWLLVG